MRRKFNVDQKVRALRLGRLLGLQGFVEVLGKSEADVLIWKR